MHMKVLMTGANGAFGDLTARALLTQEHRLVATMRDPDGRNADAAAALRSCGAIVMEIDVTDDKSVSKSVEAAIATLGGLDVLVNVAGTGTHGLSEGFTADQMLRLFNINVVGLHRMMRAALPTFRRQGAGLVINISSLLGRLSMPFYGPYSATKYAVETLSDTYRAELSQLGVDVVLVEPGGFKTSWIGNLIHPDDADCLEGYGEFANLPAQALAEYRAFLDAKPEQDPAKVAAAIVSLIETPAGARPARTVVDFVGMAEPVTMMNQQLAQVTAGLYQAFGIDGLLTLKVE
ncbi:SDR family oxidoreductase [Bradyrhizobium japonicum]|uniref:SDR family oxidoreductase n=1 Tax=Bradyrhizobium japonicum TaxID=375 RepID=UPI003392FA1F